MRSLGSVDEGQCCCWVRQPSVVPRLGSCHGGKQAYHEIEVDVVQAKALQRAVDALVDALVPWVVELGRDPDILTGDARVLDALAHLFLVAVRQRRVDVAVSSLERGLDSLTHLARLGLPGSEADGGNLCARVELCVVSFCLAPGHVPSSALVRTVKLSLVQVLGAIFASVRNMQSTATKTDSVGVAEAGQNVKYGWKPLVARRVDYVRASQLP